MANAAHVKMLHAGSDAWNSWRDAHPEIIPDFSQLNLLEALNKSNKISRFNFDEVNFDNVNFNDVNLEECVFRAARFQDTSWRNRVIEFCDFSLAWFDSFEANSRTTFRSCLFRGADVSHSNLSS